MSTPKAIFFDLDGTLLSKGKLTDSAKEALHYAKEKGVLLFVATGRHRNEIEKMPWFPGLPFDGFVTMNGAYCYVGEEAVFKKTIHKDAVRMVAEYAVSHRLYCMFCEAVHSYANMSNPAIEAAQLSYGLTVPLIRDPMSALDAEIYQMVFVGSSLYEYIRELPHCNITSWADSCYDVVAAGVNKWVGILPMLDRFGLTPGEVAAVGDGPNDIEMLTGAGYSVAMGNAPDNVKASAGFVTGHIDDGGVLEAVRYLLRDSTNH